MCGKQERTLLVIITDLSMNILTLLPRFININILCCSQNINPSKPFQLDVMIKIILCSDGYVQELNIYIYLSPSVKKDKNKSLQLELLDVWSSYSDKRHDIFDINRIEIWYHKIGNSLCGQGVNMFHACTRVEKLPYSSYRKYKFAHFAYSKYMNITLVFACRRKGSR